MTGKHPLITAFLMMFLPAVLVIVLLLFLSRGDNSLALYLICLWGVFLPVCTLPSFLAGKKGLHPFLCALPGIILILLPLYGAVGAGMAGAVLGLVACVTGQEWQKQKTETRRHGHGKK